MSTKTRPYLVNSGNNYHRLAEATNATEACKVMNGARGVKAGLLRKGQVVEALLTDRNRAAMIRKGYNDTCEFRVSIVKRHVDSKGRTTYRWSNTRRFDELESARRLAKRWAAEGERVALTENWYDGVTTRAFAKFFS